MGMTVDYQRVDTQRSSPMSPRSPQKDVMSCMTSYSWTAKDLRFIVEAYVNHLGGKFEIKKVKITYNDGRQYNHHWVDITFEREGFRLTQRYGQNVLYGTSDFIDLMCQIQYQYREVMGLEPDLYGFAGVIRDYQRSPDRES